MRSTLEVLYQARATLEDRDVPYVFSCWNSCTCGHIYGAISDSQPVVSYSFEGRVSDPESSTPYADTIVRVAIALNPDFVGSPSQATRYVSDLTSAISIKARKANSGPVRFDRDSALQVVNDAIERLELEEREAMEAVAGVEKELVHA